MAGGYRAPSSPAPVSGPGALSRRTDGGKAQAMMSLPDAAYGEQQTFREIQSGAPMAADPGMEPGVGGPTAPPPVGLGEPTQRPDEPITAGAPFGPGPGPTRGPSVQDEDLKRIARYLPSLEAAAQQDTAPQSFRTFVRYLRGYAQ